MARTAILPASAMQSATVRATKSDIQGLTYTQIPGAASFAAASPDGSLWVLATQPSGPDKYIWHYSGGSWTNISGLASRLSVAPDGTLYAINSGGGAYAYINGISTWTALGGGCRDITAAGDGSIYVISNGGGSDGAIWHYASGTWAQQPGSGNRIAASWDPNTYPFPGATITPGGFYVINSAGSLYYLAAAGYIQFPGGASVATPITGGLFALGFPTDSNGNVLYYYNLNGPGWSIKGGSGISISSDGKTLYVIGSSAAIYSAPITPVPTPSPSTNPTPTPTFGSCSSSVARVPQVSPSGPVTSFTPRPGTAVVNSQYSIESNPTGLLVSVSGTPCGRTNLLYAPAFSSSAHQIVINPNNGSANFIYATDQTADGNKTVYYNQAADTNGSIGSVASNSVSRAPQSVVRNDAAGVPRFRPFSNAGLPTYSTSRVAVHYFVSRLAAGGRRVQDIEGFERVSRAVNIGFNRGGQITRIVDVPSGTDATSFVARLKSHAEVAAAEPLQLRYKASSTPFFPNDEHFAQTDNATFPAMYEQWDMYKIGAPNAWGYTHGTPQTGNTPSPFNCSIATGSAPTPNPATAGIAIAIIDTGFDNNQADLAAGKVVYGEKVLNGVVTCGVAAAQDTDGHGSNVSGIAAANTNNGLGFAGVGFNVSLQEYKIFPNGANPSANTGDEAQAIYDAIAHGARVISMSLGGSQDGGFDPVERDAVEYAISQNVAVVAAAGNATGTTLDLPAGYDGVISVGASALNDAPNYKQYATATEAVASYSNYGPRLTIVAPGGDPPSCETVATPNCSGYPGSIDTLHWVYNLYTTTPFSPADSCSNINDCNAFYAGTSQATPHVAGAVALMLSKNPSLTVAQITQILDSTADDIGDARQGHGRLNLYRAMAQVSGDSGPANGLALPSNVNFVAFAYTNSGGVFPTIIDETYPNGVPVASDGTFRIADILSTAGTYHCAVWADMNGNGKVDAGDWFGVATGTGSGSTPCTGVTGIVAHPVGAGFTLP